MSDRVAVVVGAGGDIGGACAHRLAHDHNVVLCVDRDEARAESAAASLLARGHRAEALTADAADEAFADTVRAGALAFGRTASMVHAVAHEEHAAAAGMSRRSVVQSLIVGPVAAFCLFRAFVSGDALAGGASLVAIGSLHASVPFPGCVGYNAAHGALAQIVRTLANEWAPRRVRVNAVVPGWIRTAGEDGLYGADHLDRVSPLLPLGRFGTADEVAAAVGYVCSQDAHYVTGSFMTVDGGLAASLARLPGGAA
ncbi:SDR family NAD(P)-dependent oxidoreductase [Dactylosporangium sp. NPDC000555]|uniref:SDR family NAD(P)-dependent oxidoreductase n=1 Tax=Dactylosporangium sp. NPDC000555 TaxID=3154260 RepID=UPI00331EFD25